MSTQVDSLLDINLTPNPVINDLESRDLIEALDNIINALQILQGEVERIRIATGTSAPP